MHCRQCTGSKHLELLRPGNGDDIVSLRQEPRERNLARGRVVLLANVGQPVRDLEDIREIGGIVTADDA
jgi:hypothetical protein